MSMTKSVAVTDIFHMDLSTIRAFLVEGEPDLKLQLTFRTPHSLSTQKLLVCVHSQVLTEASPIFKGWLFMHKGQILKSVVLAHDIENVDRDCKDFREFLIFLYTKELNPVNLVPVFEYSMQFKVKLDDVNFKSTLCSRNALQLLEKFQVAGKEFSLYYLRFREFILEKIEMTPEEILSSSYFLFMGPTTLEEIIGRLVGKVAEDVLVEALLRWAKCQCDRKGVPQDIGHFMDVIPSGVIEACQLKGVALEDKFRVSSQQRPEGSGQSLPQGGGHGLATGSPEGSGHGLATGSPEGSGHGLATGSPEGSGHGLATGNPEGSGQGPRKRPAEEESSNEPVEKKQKDVKINVIVKNMIGQSPSSHVVSQSDKVSYLKDLIEKTPQGMPAAHSNLIFNHRMLDDEKTFEEYKVQDGAIIHQVMKLRAS